MVMSLNRDHQLFSDKRKIVIALTVKARQILYEEPETAMRLLRSAESIAPDDPFVRRKKSHCFLQLFDIEKAITEAERAVSLDPSASSYRCLAKALLAGRRLRGAKKAILKAISIDPDSHCFKLLARINQDGRDYKGAFTAAKRAVEIEPSAVNNYAYAQMALLSGHLEEAEAAIKESILSRGKAVDYLLYARIKLEQREFEQAIKLGLEAVSRGGDEKHYLFMARVCRTAGEIEQGIKITEEGKRNHPKSDRLKSVLADLRRKDKKYDEALGELEQMDILSYDAFMCKAYCYMHLGRCGEAFEIFKEAECLPDRDDGKFRLRVGYIFLLQNCQAPTDEMIVAAQKSAFGLWKKKVDKISEHHLSDYLCAMIYAFQSQLI